MRLTYRALKGNSGLYFRIEEKGYSGVSGFQAEIDPEHDAGSLSETNGRAWVSKPKEEEVKKWFKPGEWNEMTVSRIVPPSERRTPAPSWTAPRSRSARGWT